LSFAIRCAAFSVWRAVADARHASSSSGIVRKLNSIAHTARGAGMTMRNAIGLWLAAWALGSALSLAEEGPITIRSARSGNWSALSTWEGGSAPQAGARVVVRTGHTVTYDVSSDQAIRFIHVAGTLAFATDRSTRLDVGLIRIQPGEGAGENGFDCDFHRAEIDPSLPGAALRIGTPDQPVNADAVATIRLVAFDGMDRDTCPAIVCCGGRMEFHGAPLSRTWVKLGRAVKQGDTTVLLAEPVTGWRVGDRVVLTATQKDALKQDTLRPLAKSRRSFTEERTIAALSGQTLTLDRPVEHAHDVRGEYRGEVANLSRNVIIESADPARSRGHTIYHHGSTGSISYTEFRHLGKEGVLGKYSIHFHIVGDSMRGASVIGASIWDSANRWITIHGTDYLVVRDCVGYRSIGHGFYLEDGRESYNVLDRNLAVQAFAGKALPGQFLQFDRNDGAGFWWANSLNAFTRNVAVECDRYGYRYEATPADKAAPVRPVLRADGQREAVDIRRLPFVRFDGNEAHSVPYGMNLGEGVGGIGPDAAHPFLVRRMRIWDAYWAFLPGAPSIVLDGMDLYSVRYGIFSPGYDPLVQPYGTASFKGVRQTGYLPASPTALPGEKAPLPVGVDDRPPATVITHVATNGVGRIVIRGTTVDDGSVRRVAVNDTEARALAPNFLEWEATLERPRTSPATIKAFATDAAGNIEPRPHVLRVP
jgi:hypothetical protein